MPSICTNLKQLRESRSMTQQQAADRLHVTRQTVSSWESGRTRPDVETLGQIAALYGVSLEEVLYGDGPAVRRRRLAGHTAVAAAVWLSVGAAANAALYLIADRLFWADPGPVTDAMREVLNVRFALSDARNVVQIVFRLGFEALCIALACFWIVQDPPVSWKKKGAWLAAALLAPLAVTLLLAAFDPHIHVVNYLEWLYDVPTFCLLTVLAGTVGARIRKRWREK